MTDSDRRPHASIQPTDEQRKEAMKDWISACLYQLADPARNKDADSRVDALIALSELHGLNQPQTACFTFPSLGQLNAAIASHKGQ